MSDEENIIDQVKFTVDYMKQYNFNLKFIEAIEDFIDLYYREKEKNKILLQCLKDSQERCENEHLFLGNPNM